MRKRSTAEQSEQLFAEVLATGEGAGQVAKRMGVMPSTAYLWIKAVSPADRAVLARVVPARSTKTVLTSHMVLQVGGARLLQVEPGFDAALLRQVVAALSDSS